MKLRSIWLTCLAVAVSPLCMAPICMAQSAGKLLFDVKQFTSEVTLKPKMEEQLKAGGLEWGVTDKQLTVTMVAKQFVNAEIPYLTRFGDKKEIELPAGDYALTCVGLLPQGGFSVQKVLSKGGYFNLDVLHFSIKAGTTTTLEISPQMRKRSTLLINVFMPDITVKVIQDGATLSESIINDRTDQSIAWDKYTGPLKYVVKK